jgi:hypothetical protein
MAEVNQTNAKDTLMGVLGYIDSPFKLLVVLLLALAGFAGYFIYANQAVLIGAYQKHQELKKLDSGRYDDAAKLLFTSMKVDLVSILEVDPILGKRVVARIYTKEGRVKDMDGHKISLFSKNEANNTDVIKLMAGQVPCNAQSRPRSEVSYFYMQKGVNWTCRISAPPDPNEFVGQITVGWAKEPEGGIDKVDTNFLSIASQMIVKGDK